MAGDDRRISFLGTFPHQEMGKVLAGIDVFVVPSTWYDFPLVIPSALATKTPVVTTNIPGMNELIGDELNGLLFERGDWLGLARQMQRFLDDETLLPRLKRGIGPIKTVPEMAAEYEVVYEGLLSSRPHRYGNDYLPHQPRS